jgi:hypothetical protein
MSSETTRVNETPEIKKIQNSFDRLISFKVQQKQKADLTLTPMQYKNYCSQIKDREHVGNPRYKGIEIKKMGEA